MVFRRGIEIGKDMASVRSLLCQFMFIYMHDFKHYIVGTSILVLLKVVQRVSDFQITSDHNCLSSFCRELFVHHISLHMRKLLNGTAFHLPSLELTRFLVLTYANSSHCLLSHLSYIFSSGNNIFTIYSSSTLHALPTSDVLLMF